MHNKPVNIHNRGALEARLHHTVKVINAVAHVKDPFGMPAIDMAKAMKALRNRYLRFIGHYNRYKPHQGAQECERRRQQLNKGQIYNHHPYR